MGVVIDYTSGFFEATPTGETVGSISGNATLDLTSGNVFSHAPSANATFVFSSPPASGTGHDFTLESHAICHGDNHMAIISQMDWRYSTISTS